MEPRYAVGPSTSTRGFLISHAVAPVALAQPVAANGTAASGQMRVDGGDVPGMGSSGSGGFSPSGDSGSDEGGDSGDDGAGGTWTESWQSTWSNSSASDDQGNTSSESKTTYTYTFTDSGTTSDGSTYQFSEQINNSSDNTSVTRGGITTNTNQSEDDTTYSDQMTDANGDTYSDGGSSSSTSHGTLIIDSTGYHGKSASDGTSSDHFEFHCTAGSSSAKTSGSDQSTDHSEGTLHLWAFNILDTSTSNSTHDDSGSVNSTTDLSDDGGGSDKSGYSTKYTNHNDTQTTFDGSTWSGTYAANSTSDEEDKEFQDVQLANGNAYGWTATYNDKLTSTTAPGSGSSSTYAYDDSGSDYGNASVSAEGDSQTSDYSDHYKDHADGGSNADGGTYYNESAGGDGTAHSSLSFSVGADSGTITSHDDYQYSATAGGSTSGGNGSDDFGMMSYAVNGGMAPASAMRAGPGSSSSETSSYSSSDDNGETFQVHLVGDGGDSFDDNGTHEFHIKDDNGAVTVSANDSATATQHSADGGTATESVHLSETVSPDGTVEVSSSTSGTDSVSASFWAAIVRRDYQGALAIMKLATDTGFTIANNVKTGMAASSALPRKIYQDLPAKPQLRTVASQRAMEVFRAAGQNPTIIRIRDKLGTSWFFLEDGTPFASNKFHEAVVVGGRYFCAFTGPAGMTKAEYIAKLESLNLIPIFTNR